MASGLPIVITDCGAVREVVPDWNPISPQGDVHSMAEGLVRALGDEAASLGSRNRGHAERRFDIKQEAAQLREWLSHDLHVATMTDGGAGGSMAPGTPEQHLAWRQRLELVIPPAMRHGVRAGLAPIRRLALRGDAVECPVCDSTFRRFAAFGHPPRPEAQCPRCGSLERHRLMWLFLIRNTPVETASLRVLHVAPESGISHRLRTLRNLDYLTADLDPTKADVKMDIASIQFPDGHFDVILCSNVLEHVPDAGQAMCELRRVLAPSGFALLDVPIRSDLEDTYEDWSITSPQGTSRGVRSAQPRPLVRAQLSRPAARRRVQRRSRPRSHPSRRGQALWVASRRACLLLHARVRTHRRRRR